MSLWGPSARLLTWNEELHGETAPASSEQAVADVVFPGEMRQFKVAHAAIHPGLPLRLEVVTDQGPFEVPVTLARQ